MAEDQIDTEYKKRPQVWREQILPYHISIAEVFGDILLIKASKFYNKFTLIS